MDWYDQGYYKLYGNLKAKDPDRWIAKQYLEDTVFDVTPELNRLITTGIGRETYNGCQDYPKFNLLTLNQAKHTNIDIVICSVHENEPYFAKLKEFYPNAKFIRQVGNDLDTNIDSVTYPNLLASAKAPFEGFTGHKVLYRQEFPLNLFKYEVPTQFNNIYSFQNNLEEFEDTWDAWTNLKHQLRDYKFQSFGGGNDQGKIYPKKDLIKKMLEATFIFQSKGPWEGYGHVIHNAICLGRPMIIKRSDYAGKLAEPLLVEGVTYLEMTDPDLVNNVKHYSDPERYRIMSETCREIFKQAVNFDDEFIELKEFFENLM